MHRRRLVRDYERRWPVVLTLGPGWAGQVMAGLARPAGLAEALATLESLFVQ